MSNSKFERPETSFTWISIEKNDRYRAAKYRRIEAIVKSRKKNKNSSSQSFSFKIELKKKKNSKPTIFFKFK
jgi:hypothetical protein